MKKQYLINLVNNIFKKHGLNRTHSKICTEALINAELVGATSHGLSRLKMYCDRIKKKDVSTAPTGQNGSDILLSKTARKLVGMNFECKNQNKMKTIYDWYKQSSKNSKGLVPKLIPCVAMKMNTRAPLVVIDLDDFFTLIQ